MSKGRGKAFEEEIRLTFSAYQRQNLAYVEKVDPPTVTFGRGKGVRIIHKANPFLDFTGSWTEYNGASLHFEVKETESPRLPVGRDGGLSANQWRALLRWHHSRAVAFVLWRHGAGVRLLTVPQISDVMQSRASATLEHGHEVPQGTGMILWDCLAILRLIYTQP